MINDPTPVYISRRKRSLGKYWPAALVLLVALVVTVVGWRLATEQVNQKITALFNQEKAVIINRLTKSSDQKVDVLRSFQELYASNVEVVKDVFELFAQIPANTFPDIQSIAYAPLVDEKNRAAVTSYAWNLGYAGWRISPAGIRAKYYPLLYVVPAQPNQDVVGLDYHAVPTVAAAMDKAVETGEILSTPVFTSPVTRKKVFLFVVPIYAPKSAPKSADERRAASRGLCLLTIPAVEFVGDALTLSGDSLQVQAAVYDGVKDPASLVFGGAPDTPPMIARDETISLASHSWLLAFTTRPGFGKDINTSFPWIVLGTGCVISVLLFAFMLSLLSSRSRALDLAARMTRSQRRIVDSSRDMIAVLGFDGLWKSMNAASKEALGFDPDDLIGRPHAGMIYRADSRRVTEALATAPDETPVTIEARYIDGSGAIQWISWSVTSSTRDNLIYLIGRNITAKRLHDDAIRAKNRQLDLAGLIADRENRRHDSFVREQSMNLRTEMTGILGFLDLVITDPDLSRDDQIEYLSTARDSAAVLMDIPRRIMEMSSVQISEIAFTPRHSELNNLRDQVCAEITKRDSACAVVIEDVVPKGYHVNIDPERFRQSIASLVARMQGYQTLKQVRIALRVDAASEFARFVFAFPSAVNAPDTFQHALTTADNSALLRDDETYEIGFARLLIELLNGTIHLDSDGNETRITVEIPLIES